MSERFVPRQDQVVGACHPRLVLLGVHRPNCVSHTMGEGKQSTDVLGQSDVHLSERRGR